MTNCLPAASCISDDWKAWNFMGEKPWAGKHIFSDWEETKGDYGKHVSLLFDDHISEDKGLIAS